MKKRFKKLIKNKFSFDQGAEGDAAFEKAMNDPDLYVVKPQREGGGNNVYGEEIRFLLFSFFLLIFMEKLISYHFMSIQTKN